MQEAGETKPTPTQKYSIHRENGKEWSLSLNYQLCQRAVFSFVLKILFIYSREMEGEKHQCVVASHTPLTGDPAHNPGMCPDWKSNL